MNEESDAISAITADTGGIGSPKKIISLAAIDLNRVIDIVETSMQEHNIGGSDPKSRNKDALNVANNLAQLTSALRCEYDDDLELCDAMLGLCRIIERRRGEPYGLNDFRGSISDDIGARAAGRGEYDSTTMQGDGGNVAFGGVSLRYTKNTPGRGLDNLAPNTCVFIIMVDKPLLLMALVDIMKWYNMDCNDIHTQNNAYAEIVDRIHDLSEEGSALQRVRGFLPWEIFHDTMFQRAPFMDYVIVTSDSQEVCETEEEQNAGSEDSWFETVSGFKVVLVEDTDTIDMDNYDFTERDIYSLAKQDYLDYSNPETVVNDICDYMIHNHRHFFTKDSSGEIDHHAFNPDALSFVECLSRLKNPHDLDSTQTISLRKRGFFETAGKLYDHLLKYFVNFHFLCLSMIVGAIEVWHHERASYFEKIIGFSIPAKMNSDGSRHGPDDYKGCHRWYNTHSLESKLARESLQSLSKKIHGCLLGTALSEFHESKVVNPHYDPIDRVQSDDDHNDKFDAINGLRDRNYEAPRAIYYLHRIGICDVVRESNVCTRNAHRKEPNHQFVNFTGTERIEMSLRQSNWDDGSLDEVISHLNSLHPNSYTGRQAVGIKILKECSDMMDNPPPGFGAPYLNEMIKCLRNRGTFVLARNTYRIFNCFAMRLHKLIRDFEDEKLLV